MVKTIKTTSHFIIKSRFGVTAIEYGILAAFMIVAALAAIAYVGNGENSVFAITGTTIENTMLPSGILGTPSVALTGEEASEIQNANQEVANGTASLACLQDMQQNPSTMASNDATCIGPGDGIPPPPSPVINTGNFYNAFNVMGGECGYSQGLQVEQDGTIYAVENLAEGGNGTGHSNPCGPLTFSYNTGFDMPAKSYIFLNSATALYGYGYEPYGCENITPDSYGLYACPANGAVPTQKFTPW